MTHTPRIKELYAEGMKKIRIAEKLGVARSTVYWALHPEKHRENRKRWRDNNYDKYIAAQNKYAEKREAKCSNT